MCTMQNSSMLQTRGLQYKSCLRNPLMLLLTALLITIGCGCSKKPADAAAAQPQPADDPTANKKILVLHSYHLDYEWVRAINRGINVTLSSDTGIEIQHFYMDTKRHADTAWKQQITSEAMELIHIWQPDIIIAADDNAQDLIGRKVAQEGKIPWVFCGVNGKPEAYGYPADNVTGVLERLHFLESLELFKKIDPDAKRIVFVSDFSPTSQAVIDYARNLPQLQTIGLDVVDWVMPKTFSEWKQTILKYHDTVDAFAVYTYHTVKLDEFSSESMPASEVMEWTSQNSHIPIIGFLIFSTDNGVFCGMFESGIEQGKIAAQMALQILAGTPPYKLEYTTPKQGQTAINMGIAEKLNINVPDAILKTADLIIENQKPMLNP